MFFCLKIYVYCMYLLAFRNNKHRSTRRFLKEYQGKTRHSQMRPSLEITPHTSGWPTMVRASQHLSGQEFCLSVLCCQYYMAIISLMIVSCQSYMAIISHILISCQSYMAIISLILISFQSLMAIISHIFISCQSLMAIISLIKISFQSL